MRRRLILLRHGQTEYNAARRLQGQLDTHLTPAGVEQARAAAQWLRAFDVVRVVSSDLSRARDTAEIVAQALGLEVSVDPRLRETHLGQWQGLAQQDVSEGQRNHWRTHPDWAPPGGESRLDVARRARPVVDELMEAFPEWSDDAAVLLVAHGGTISALTSSLLGLQVEQYPLFKGLGNANASCLCARPGHDGEDTCWHLEAWNKGWGE